MANEKGLWTVMVYLAGQNNLSEECVSALKQMKRVVSSGTPAGDAESPATDKIRIVAQLGSNGSGGTEGRYLLRRGERMAGSKPTLSRRTIRERQVIARRSRISSPGASHPTKLSATCLFYRATAAESMGAFSQRTPVCRTPSASRNCSGCLMK